MTNIEMKTLLDSMKAAIDLETEKATQEAIIKRYNAKMAEIEPQLVTEKLPVEPVRPEYNQPFQPENTGIRFVRIYSIILAVVFFIVTLVNFFNGELIGACIAFGVSLLFIGLFSIPHLIKKKKTEKTNEEMHELYEKEYASFQKESEAITKRNERATQKYNSDMAEWKKRQKEDIAVLSKHLAETNALLNQLYDTDFIYSKYRNLPALTSIYEYFITGRCESLTGAHGAYNMYEDEVRKDTVISQLNLVIQNLEQIKQNQYMLYQQVSLMNGSLSAISRDIAMIRLNSESIMQFSAINAYYAGLTAAHTRISATMHLLNG